jgi:uncharacterized protein (TIGR00730 family)
MQRIKKVCFFGYAQSGESDEEYIAAYETAKEVVKTGRTVINGGGPGVMYAATKGAKDAGGHVSVVYYVPKSATHFEGKNELTVNLADEEFEEENYINRTQRLIEMADAYVVFNGGTGTVSEFAMTWGLARLYIGHHKPLILYGAFWKNIMDAFWNNMKVREDAYRVFKYAVEPHQVVEELEEYEAVFEAHTGHTDPAIDCAGNECQLFISHEEHNHDHDEVEQPEIKSVPKSEES